MAWTLLTQKIGGWGAELNREIVSCRTCVRAVCMSSEFGVKKYGPLLSLFPFGPGRFSLFPSPAPQSPIQLQLALSVLTVETQANRDSNLGSDRRSIKIANAYDRQELSMADPDDLKARIPFGRQSKT